MSDKVRTIKRAQREKLLLRHFSDLFLRIIHEQPELNDLMVSRISLSADRSICSVFFYTQRGNEAFEEILDILKLYRSSLRTALARRIDARYTPELVFKFDLLFAKHQRIESLIDAVSKEEES